MSLSRPSRRSRLQAVLFDVTGTLLEPAEEVGALYSRIAAQYGVELTPPKINAAFRKVLAAAPPMVFPNNLGAEAEQKERSWWHERVRETFARADAQVRFANFEHFFDALFDAYAQPQAWRCLPHTLPLLQHIMGQKLRIGVVSNFDHRLPDILQAFKISRFLDTLIYPSRCGLAKPDPAIFQLALKELRIPPEAALYVGHDPIRDLAGAREAGLSVLDLNDSTECEPLAARIDRIATVGA